MYNVYSGHNPMYVFINGLFTARSSYASAVLGIVILSVRQSVRQSVTHVLCEVTKEHTAEILHHVKW